MVPNYHRSGILGDSYSVTFRLPMPKIALANQGVFVPPIGIGSLYPD